MMRDSKSVRLGMWTAAASAAAAVMVFGLALAAPVAPGPGVAGNWQGAISSGGSALRIVVHFSQAKTGELTGTMDSPDQGATGIVISSVNYAQPDLHFAIEKFGAGYEGKFDGAKQQIEGVWKQGAASLPLTLSRVKE